MTAASTFILGSVVQDDRRLERWIVDHRVAWLDWPFEQLSHIGAYGLVWLFVAAAFALLRRRASLFVLVLAADALAEFVTDLLKLAIPRTRPHLSHLVALPHSHSFPSGHTATSFACATVLAALVPRFRVAFFVLAAAIGYSRLYNGVHYPLDVLAGAVLGTLTALLLLATLRRGSRRGWRRG